MSEKAQILNALNPEGEVRFGEIVIRGDSTVEKDGYRRDEKNSYRVHPERLPALQRQVDEFAAQKHSQVQQLRRKIEAYLDEQEQHRLLRDLMQQQSYWNDYQKLGALGGGATTSSGTTTGGLVYGSSTSGKDPNS